MNLSAGRQIAGWTPKVLSRGHFAVASALLMALSTSAFFYANRSISFDDGDSLSFALALHDFDLAKQQPQAPGFPLYVASARMLLAVQPDALWALTTLSSLGAGLAVAGVFWLAYAFAGNRVSTGFAGAALLAFAPAFWLTGEKALSDVPAVAAVLWAIAALWAARGRGAVVLALSAFAAAVSLGFRPQNAVALAPFAVYCMWRCLDQRKPARVLSFIGGAAAGISLWLVPLSISSGGLPRYLDLAQAQSRHVLTADSIFAIGPLSSASIRYRTGQFFDTLAGELAGIVLPEGSSASVLIGLAIGLLVFIFALSAISWRHTAGRLVVVWLALGLAQNFVLESLDRPRLMLLFVPAIAILAAMALNRLPSAAALICALAASTTLFIYCYPLVTILSSQAAPAEQATAFVRGEFRSSDTLLAAAGSFRHLQYDLPDYQIYYLYSFNRQSMKADIDGGRYARVVVFDRDEFQGVQDVLSEGQNYLLTSDITFERDPRVHREHRQVRVVVLTRADLLVSGDRRLPPNGVIQLGANDEMFLGSGWFRREEIGAVPGRWVGGSGAGEIRLALAPAGYRLRFFATAFPPGQSVTLVVNGSRLTSVSLKQDWAEYEVKLPSSLLTKPVTVIGLEHSVLLSAFEASEGASTDRRPLAAAYSWFSFKTDP